MTANTFDVNDGLSVSGILNLGDDETMYSALTSNTISTTSDRMEDVHTLLTQLSTEANTEIQDSLISQITTLLDDEARSLQDRVQSDLTAQDIVRSAESVNQVASLGSTLDSSSNLFNLIATPQLKDLADSLAAV